MESDSSNSQLSSLGPLSLSSDSLPASLGSPPASPGASSDADSDSAPSDGWPAGYPLPIDDIYNSWPANDSAPSSVRSSPQAVDPRVRYFRSLYNLDLLDRRSAVDIAHDVGPGADYAILRKKWKQRFQRDQNGNWDYVEYAPAWTDPEWDERYVYMGVAAPWPDDHPLARQYAKPGSMQAQRPALRSSDRYLNPSATAKRWGFYPYQTVPTLDGSSGVTPTKLEFPTVPLAIPRWSDSMKAVQTEVTIDDMKLHRQQYEAETQAAGGTPSDEGFRSYLVEATNRLPRESELWDLADKLLQLFDLMAEQERRQDYQSMLFSGNTTNELVRQGVWTMGLDAKTDLAEPLHDLVTRDKWAITEQRGVKEDEPRTVYNISGKRGELTAHNDEVWQVLQPALQLVSKILASDHPVTWAWADLRKLRPVRDGRSSMTVEESQQNIDAYTTSRGVYRHDVFSVWPDFSCLEHDLDRVTARWNDVSQLVEAGFNTTRYVCDILKHTIEWDLKPMYRLGEYLEPEDKKPQSALGTTITEKDDAPGAKRPFKIRIGLAAEYVWQLLVDEYSSAEKAAVSFAIAATMLHEISHALNEARLQMCASRADHTTDPLWLTIKPAWKQEVQAFSQATGVDVLRALTTHGLRHCVNELDLQDGLMRTSHETFLEDEPENEEGWATENQYFGGISDSIGNGSHYSFKGLATTRFLSDIAIMAALRTWKTVDGAQAWFQFVQGIPAESYLKLFRKDFWEGSFKAYGHEAMKLTTGQPLPGTVSLTKFSWALTDSKFGRYAAAWMENVHNRLSDENDNYILWKWLYYKTMLAVEHLEVYRIWSSARRKWGATDRAIWKTAGRLKSRSDMLRVKIVESANFGGVGELVAQDIAQVLMEDPVTHPDPLEVVEDFRAYYASLRAAVRDLSREVTFNQNIAAAYARLDDEDAKQTIRQVYARKFRARMGLIYIITIDNIASLLDSLDSFSDMVLALLNATNGIRQIMGEGRDDLRAKLNTIRLGFMAVMAIFSDDEEERMLGLQSLNAIPPSAVKSSAGRLERIAKLEYSRLQSGSNLKNIADDWMLILQSGDALISPPPGSDAEAFNQALDVRNRSIRMTTAAQRQAAEAQYPDPQGGVQEQASNLASQQPQNWQLSQGRDFNDQQQHLYAAATGFRPFNDPQTGFTRFENLGVQVQPALAANAYTGAPVFGIDQRTARAQYMAQTATVYPNQISPLVPPWFGADAAQSSHHLQQVEAMMRRTNLGHAANGQLSMAAQDSQQAIAAGSQGIYIPPYAVGNHVQAMSGFPQAVSGGQVVAEDTVALVNSQMAQSFANFVDEHFQHAPHRGAQ